MRLAYVFWLAFLPLALFVGFAHAEDVMFNKTEQADFYFNNIGGDPRHASSPFFRVLSNPNITIKYHVRVVDAGTNSILTSGATVPQGTSIRLEFIEHVFEDAYWFATGHAADSPNGDWVTGAANPPGSCNAKDEFFGPYTLGPANLTAYIPFSVHPPTKYLAGLSGMTCTGIANDSQECTLNQTGTFNPQFVFDQTYAKFWYERYVTWNNGNSPRCEVYPEEMSTANTSNPPTDRYNGVSPSYMNQPPYQLTVPLQTVPFSITVEQAPGSAPATPLLVSGGACTVGQLHSISFSSIDPDGDNLRYGVDWDNDDLVDQWVPPTGYVSSGTTQSASRTYATEGQKTVQVLAQDETGLSSSWASVSFQCVDETVVALCADDLDNDGDSLIDLDDPGCLSGGDNDETDPEQTLFPDLSLRVVPSLVRTGNTTKVNWSATDVVSCTVTGDNGDEWEGLESVIGGEISSPITGETVYILSCLDSFGLTLTETAVVRTIPLFQEL